MITTHFEYLLMNLVDEWPQLPIGAVEAHRQLMEFTQADFGDDIAAWIEFGSVHHKFSSVATRDSLILHLQANGKL